MYPDTLDIFISDKHGVDLAKIAFSKAYHEARTGDCITVHCRQNMVDLCIIGHKIYYTCDKITYNYIEHYNDRPISFEQYTVARHMAEHKNVTIADFIYDRRKSDFVPQPSPTHHGVRDATLVLRSSAKATYNISKYFALISDIRIYFHKRPKYPADMTIVCQ
jgi:hypothetical protein